MSLFLSGVLGNTFQGLVSYQQAFALLWIPLVFVVLAALIGRSRVPRPELLEAELQADAAPDAVPASGKLSRTFWIYSVFTLLTAWASSTSRSFRSTPRRRGGTARRRGHPSVVRRRHGRQRRRRVGGRSVLRQEGATGSRFGSSSVSPPALPRISRRHSAPDDRGHRSFRVLAGEFRRPCSRPVSPT